MTADQLKERMNQIDSAEALPREDKIELLGAMVKAKSTAGGWRPDQNQVAVANRAAGLLIDIPGHAEYFRDRLLAAQVAHRDDITSILAGAKFNDYLQKQGDIIEVLGQLRSIETVKVLGEFLSDSWINPATTERRIEERIGPMSLVAVRALSKLPLANKPANTRYDHEAEGDLKSWQLWYGQIKAGTRTFRFEDDPQEYDLSGPASAEKLREIEQGRIRDGEKGKGRREAESEARKNEGVKGVSVGIVVSGILVATVAVWYFVRRGKKDV